MRPVSTEFEINQPFGSMATAGVAASSDPASGTGYYVYLYGNYQPFGHAGCDIACPEGTPVKAIAAGTVLWADWGTNLPGDESDWGYRQRWYLYKGFPGIVTVIQHDGWVGVYAHLSEAWMNPGDRVTEGQQIGLSGGTGGVAPHLHVEALIDLNYPTGGGLIYGRTNPEPYFGGIAAMGEIITPLEDDMGHVDTISEDAAKVIAQKLWEYDFTNANGKPNRPIWVLQSLPETLVGQVQKTADAVLRGPLKWFGFDGKQPNGGRTTTTVETALGFGDTIANQHSRQITELRAVVDQLALGQGVTIDYQAIAKAVVDEEARRLTPPQ